MTSKKPAAKPASKKQGGTAVAETTTQSTALASNVPMLINGKSFKAKLVTLPLLLITDGAEIAVRIDGPMHKGSVERSRTGADGKKEEPMTLCAVTVLETGELRNLICAKVIESALGDTYPDNGYVGRYFAIRCNGKVEGKRHKAYTVAELIADDAE